MSSVARNGSTPGERHDVDWVIVGSGFGGSVSALRLAEKGYSVRVLECGRRYRDEELPGRTPEEGVIDGGHWVFGYENLMVCDGAAVPFNPGVNPSLTITAMAERAMTSVPGRDGIMRAPGTGLQPLRLGDATPTALSARP
jgi:choline dehydrogenase-like flavoprotein